MKHAPVYYGLKQLTEEEMLNLSEYIRIIRQNKIEIVDNCNYIIQLMKMIKEEVRDMKEFNTKYHAELIYKLGDRVNAIYDKSLEVAKYGLAL